MKFNGKSPKRELLWECQCVACGEFTQATSTQLSMGRKKSCGCMKHPPKTHAPNWTGHGEISGKRMTDNNVKITKDGMILYITYTGEPYSYQLSPSLWDKMLKFTPQDDMTLHEVIELIKISNLCLSETVVPENLRRHFKEG